MTLKASFMCSKTYREQFPNPRAQLTISVGQPIHEGERLSATVKLVNQSFTHCTIMIDDSIQWYTLAINTPNTPQATLLEQAIQAGDDYLKRNQALFENTFTIPYQIIRWKDWHNTIPWQQAIIKMTQDYETNPLLQQGIDQNVHTFLTRYEKNKASHTYDRTIATILCTHYLIEECAIMRTFWVDLGCHYEVYPSRRNEAMSATYRLCIEPHYTCLLPISLRFHRLKNTNELASIGV